MPEPPEERSGRRGSLHLFPTWKTGYKHRPSPQCWCRPRRRQTPDGLSVYVHDWRFVHVAAVYEDESGLAILGPSIGEIQ